MITLWCNIMHRVLGVDYETSKHMIHTENKWDLYMDTNLNSIMITNRGIHGYIFELLQYPERRITKWIDHISNPFYSCKTRDEWIYTYCKTQHVYFAFAKFARLWKVKRAKISVTNDLCMNELSIESRNTIKIYQNGVVYLFALNELVHICTTALINSPNFFTTPLHPKNPYTNIPFSDAILLHIYLSMRYSNIKISNILHYFYQSSFDTSVMTIKYEYALRAEYIDYFCKFGDTDERLEYMFDMLELYNKPLFERFSKNSGFPEKILLDAMTPFLCLYIRLKYSVTRINKLGGRIYLQQELDNFKQRNYMFGRSMMVKKQGLFYKTLPRYTHEIITDYIRHTIDMNKLTECATLYDYVSIDSSDDESIS